MKRTVLDLTQSILSSLGSDEVNSISDTTESLQVAEIIKTSYLNMVSRLDLPPHNQLFQLTSSDNMSQPVLMYVPAGVNRIEYVKYFDVSSDTSDDTTYVHDLNLDITTIPDNSPSPPSYQEITILAPKVFLDMVNAFNTDESDVSTQTFTSTSLDTGAPSAFQFNYKTGQNPRYCTFLQNYYVLFDAFDSSVDSTLQTSKTLCSGWVQPTFQMIDTYIPPLDDKQYALLLNEAKSLAFLELKQMPHPKADKEIARQMSSLQKFKSVTDKPTAFQQLPNFGRRGGGWATL